MIKKISIFLIMVFGLLACNNQEQSSAEKEYKKLMKEVLDIHDEVMPKMGEIGRLIGTLEAKQDTTDTQKTHVETAEQLKEAHDFMMEWMKDFSEKFPDAMTDKKYSDEEYKERIELLKEEKEEVTTMKNQVNTSIKNAEKLLKK